MRKGQLVFLGIGSHAVALDAATGVELWRQKLKSSGIATIGFDGDGNVLAGAGGEVWSLDPSTGAVRWHNKLPRLGHGVVTFASSPTGAIAAAVAAAAAAAAAAGS